MMTESLVLYPTSTIISHSSCRRAVGQNAPNSSRIIRDEVSPVAMEDPLSTRTVKMIIQMSANGFRELIPGSVGREPYSRA